jgi:hypothetical protein
MLSAALLWAIGVPPGSVRRWYACGRRERCRYALGRYPMTGRHGTTVAIRRAVQVWGKYRSAFRFSQCECWGATFYANTYNMWPVR